MNPTSDKKKGTIKKEEEKKRLHKKNDDYYDEEKGGLIIKQMEKDNTDKIDALGDNVSTIKKLTDGMRGHLQGEKKVLGDLDKGFTKSAGMVKESIGKIDSLLNQGSSSICCYVIVFTVLIVALLVKLS